METAILITCILLLVLCLLMLFRLFTMKGGSDGINRMLSENSSSLRQEIGENVRGLGTMLSQSQQTAQNARSAQLKMLEQRFSTLESNNAQALESMRKAMNSQLDSMRDDMTKQLELIRNNNNSRLESIQNTVSEKLDKKMTESFSLVSERLEQVYKGLGEMQTIASGVGDLKKVFSNVKNRGILGEIQLGAILDDILAPEQYDTDTAVVPGSSNRVEYAVKLPGSDGSGSVYLPIDSKFPGDTYAALQDAYDSADPAAIDAAKKRLSEAVKSCAKDIHDKYISPPYTTNFAIMFLPFEGLYAEVVNSSLVETLQRKYSVNVAGPSTMASLLSSLRMGFRTLAIQKRSNEVWELLGAVKKEFGTFSTVLEETRKHIGKVDEDLEKLIGVRTRQINKKLSSVEELSEADSIKLLSSDE